MNVLTHYQKVFCRFDLGSGEVFAVTQETVREGVNNTITVSRYNIIYKECIL